MSTLEQAQPAGEARERGVLVREFDAAITGGDGRTVEMRIVPFGERAVLRDGLGGVPVGEPYEEEWMPGCFDKQLRAADKVFLNFEHDGRLAGIIGRGMQLRSASDGYHGSFRLLNGPDSDKALELVHEGVLAGASIEVPMRTVRSQRSRDGVIQRLKGHLDAVALCRRGAFSGAVVTAVREAEMEIIDDAYLAPDIDRDLAERCGRLGISLPERYARAMAANDSSEGADAEALAVLDRMIAMGQALLDAEDDPDDKAAMQRVLDELRQLRDKESSETA